MPKVKTPAELHRTVNIGVLVTKAERDELRQAAETELVPLSSWVRAKMLTIVRERAQRRKERTVLQHEAITVQGNASVSNTEIEAA
jgi:hypothetical protein